MSSLSPAALRGKSPTITLGGSIRVDETTVCPHWPLACGAAAAGAARSQMNAPPVAAIAAKAATGRKDIVAPFWPPPHCHARSTAGRAYVTRRPLRGALLLLR